MSNAPEESVRVRERIQLLMDLFEAGEEMMRTKLRREHPDARDEEIERRLVNWLHERPGAEDGDGPGVRVPWPRGRR
jgi:hypothetical protein